jgi:hypothetical protein
VEGAWRVRFTPGWGAPEQVTFDRLLSWTEQADAGIRNYSGSAVYVKEIDLPVTAAGEQLELDLGAVAVVASATLNGKSLGSRWKAPWRFELDGAARPGWNRLEVTVANLWVNRLIADAGLPEDKRLSWTTYNPCKPGDPLLPSGLLGPVSVRVMKAEPALPRH